MKLHLPCRLYRAVLAVLTLVSSFTYAGQAGPTPDGYTEIHASTVDDVLPYLSSDYYAFILENDLIFDNSGRFAGYHFFACRGQGV